MAGWGGNDNGFVNIVPRAPETKPLTSGSQQPQQQQRQITKQKQQQQQQQPKKQQKQQQQPQQQQAQRQQRPGGRSALPINPATKPIKYVDVKPVAQGGPKVTFNGVFAESAAQNPNPKNLNLISNRAYDDKQDLDPPPRQSEAPRSEPTKVVQVGAWSSPPTKKETDRREAHERGERVRGAGGMRSKAKGNRASPGSGGVMQTFKKRTSDFFGLGDDPYGGMYHEHEVEPLNEPPTHAGKMFNKPKPNNLPPVSVLASTSSSSSQLGAELDDVFDEDDARKQISKIDEGLLAYNDFIKKEKVYNKKTFGATTIAGTIRQQMSVQTGVGTGTGTIKLSEKTMIQHELLSLPEFKPIFIKGISFVQFLVMAAMIGYSMTVQEFAKFGFSATEKTCDSDCPVSFNGSSDVSAYKVTQVNPWLGPNTNFLIAFNAKYSLCMREDSATTLQNNKQRVEECGNLEADNQFNAICDGGSGVGLYEGMSCCVLGISTNRTNRVITDAGEYASFKTSGTAYAMMSHANCMKSTGALWLFPNNAQTLCTGGSTGVTTTLNVAVRPCCVGVRGKCQLLTKSQCVYKSGVYHEDEQLCGDVACLSEVCKTKFGASTKQKGQPFDSDIENPNQWYRFIAPLFIHSGGVSFIVILIAQVYLGCPIERTVGFLRMFLIYFISGIGGYLVSGLFDPYVVSVGANPAVFGLLGVMLVELLQSWSVVPNPKRKLAVLLLIISVAIILGSLPFIDNYAQIGGFLFGTISACIFLPYIALGKWHSRGRKILLAIAAPLLLILIIVLIVLFYSVQNTDFCPGCKQVNCWQWHSSLSCDGARDD